MTIYRIYRRVNYADTCRDPDDIRIEELGYKINLEEAKKIAKKYIKDNFFKKDTVLHENNDGSWSGTDFCSYGATVIIQPIEVT